ncbi:MAG: transcriptional regulator, AraC family [Paenibacillus sp.]|jgi:AraC-like DNA-binding protein/mannose-6-phosphate isomerase-like protein (cupin superfamily)|nr:transcriptional regulator, AraC family [Paenibacillus sp.]
MKLPKDEKVTVLNSYTSENYNIRTRIGSLLFDIYLDDTFLSAHAPHRSNRHNHSMMEIHFIVSGKGVLVLNREEITLKPNHYYVIPAGVYHAILAGTDKLEPLCKYTFRFEYVELKETESYYPASEIESLRTSLCNMQYSEAADHDGNLSLLQQIIHELETRPLGYYAKLQAYFNQILIHVLRSNTSLQTSAYHIPNRISDDQRSHVIDTFFDQYNMNLTLEDLADLLHLSTRQTNRIIRQLYNTTFRDKLADIRIEEAKDRLRNTNDSVTLISEQLGFASQSFFSTLFKRKTGMTPLNYRKNKIPANSTPS